MPSTIMFCPTCNGIVSASQDAMTCPKCSGALPQSGMAEGSEGDVEQDSPTWRNPEVASLKHRKFLRIIAEYDHKGE
jgi:hypothetical protein